MVNLKPIKNMNQTRLVVLVIAVMSVSSVLLAQPPSGGGPPGGSTPIDGGVVALLAGAIAYGYKSLKARNAQ